MEPWYTIEGKNIIRTFNLGDIKDFYGDKTTKTIAVNSELYPEWIYIVLENQESLRVELLNLKEALNKFENELMEDL